MSFETTNGLKNAPEVISEGLKIKNFSWEGGGACPQTSLQVASSPGRFFGNMTAAKKYGLVLIVSTCALF